MKTGDHVHGRVYAAHELDYKAIISESGHAVDGGVGIFGLLVHFKRV